MWRCSFSSAIRAKASAKAERENRCSSRPRRRAGSSALLRPRSAGHDFFHLPVTPKDILEVIAG